MSFSPKAYWEEKVARQTRSIMAGEGNFRTVMRMLQGLLGYGVSVMPPQMRPVGKSLKDHTRSSKERRARRVAHKQMIYNAQH